MQLRLDAADRLVELVEEHRGPVPAEDAVRRLLALRRAPVALARSLLTEIVDADARLAWNGDMVALAQPPGAAAAPLRATVDPAQRRDGLRGKERPGRGRACRGSTASALPRPVFSLTTHNQKSAWVISRKGLAR